MIGDDLIAAARVVKAGVGATLGCFNFATLFTNYITISVSVSIALVASISAFASLYGLLSFSYTFLGDILDSQIYAFISYTLNFDFLQAIFTGHYLTLVTVISLYVFVGVFYLSVILVPHLLSVIRSTLNWMTGDS